MLILFRASNLIRTNEGPKSCDCPIPSAPLSQARVIVANLLGIVDPRGLALLLGQPKEEGGGSAGEKDVKASLRLEPPGSIVLL